MAETKNESKEQMDFLKDFLMEKEKREKLYVNLNSLEHQLLMNDALTQSRQAATGFVPVVEKVKASLYKLSISPVHTDLDGSSGSSRGMTPSPDLCS